MGVRIQRFPVSNCCNKKARIKSSCKQTETSVTSSINQMVIRSPTLFQRCLLVDTTSRRGATSNQRWSNVVYFNVGICNVEQRWINVVYFNVDINNVRQRRNNIVIFNVDMNNVGKRRNNVVKMTISKKNKTNHFK